MKIILLVNILMIILQVAGAVVGTLAIISVRNFYIIWKSFQR